MSVMMFISHFPVDEQIPLIVTVGINLNRSVVSAWDVSPDRFPQSKDL